MSVLFIDDNDVILTLFEQLCRVHKIKCFFADHPDKALQICDTEEVSLIVTDFIMPEMNGAQLAAMIRQKLPDIEIFCFSGSAYEDSMVKSFPGLFDKFFKKPLDLSRMFSEICASLAQKKTGSAAQSDR